MYDLPRILLLVAGSFLLLSILAVVLGYLRHLNDDNRPHAGHVLTISISYALLLGDVLLDIISRFNQSFTSAYPIRLMAISLGLTAMVIMLKYYGRQRH